MEDFNENNPGGEEQEFLPYNPVEIEEHEEKHDELIRRTLIEKMGFEADEIKTLFPDRDSLRKAMVDAKKLRTFQDTSLENETEAEPEDDYELPESDKKEMRRRIVSRKAVAAREDAKLENEGAEMLGEDVKPVGSLKSFLERIEKEDFGLEKQ